MNEEVAREINLKDIPVYSDSAYKYEQYYKAQGYLEAIEKARVLVKAIKGLTQQLDRVHSDPTYENVWRIAQMHIGSYQGPKYEKEMEEAKEALAQWEKTK